ncbi:MAG: MobF family relaxase [Leptospirillum sp.]
MLSIVTRGNGTAAQDYYEHLVTDKDRQIEDYYAKNEQGRWTGRGAEALGLSGTVRKEEFRDLAVGFDPKTGKALVRQAGETHRSGWDLTFSAPKSVSVAWALGDDETRKKISSAHDRAVEAALSYMERHAAFCRTGHGEKDEIQSDLACAVYRHYTSREQDPQLHSHAFVFNVGVGEDGKTRTLEGSHFFEWKMAGGAAYRVVLAKELQDLGYTTARDGKSFRLKEIDRGLEAIFSTRRNQIEAALEERGISGAKASEVATLATRKGKKERDPEELRKDWQERAERYSREFSLERERALSREKGIKEIETSLSYQDARRVLTKDRIRVDVRRDPKNPGDYFLPDRRSEYREYEKRAGSGEQERLVFEWVVLEALSEGRRIDPSHLKRERDNLLDQWDKAREKDWERNPEVWIASLTGDRSTFTSAQAHAKVLQEMQGMVKQSGLEEAEHLVEEALSGTEIVSLVSRPGRERYTTREMLRIEREMVDKARILHGRTGHGVHQNGRERLLEQKTLSPEQRAMLRAVTQGFDITLVQGWAGTGKSYALGAAREVWEGEGYRIRGAALSGKAAVELANGSGIRSATLATLEQEIGDGGTDPLTSRDILVIDEAGMVGSRKMHELLSLAEKTRAKIVLVGDKRQLPAIEAGAAFRLLQETLGYSELSGIRRQESERDRQAVRDLAVGNAEKALENLAKRDRVHEYETGRTMKEGIGEAVSRDLAEGKVSLAISATRDEARDINEWARIHAREKGLVAPEGLRRMTSHGEREFARGDRVLFTRNDRKLEVMNGDFGTVRGTLNGILRIELDRGGIKEIDLLSYSHLDYGYAATCHKLQGATVDRCHVYASENGMGGREWAYVAASRAREGFHIHAEKTTLRELAPQWARSRGKDTTLDYEGEQNHGRRITRDLSGARRHLGAAKDLVRGIDAALGHLGEREGLRRTLALRYLERACYQDRSLDRGRAEEEFMISMPSVRKLERKQERERHGPELGF